ncbi:hypothetical protein VKT23_006021 [Stygiomarasmius scandens]|uniref:Uncharacterized protein n=1 Tax=Marasmiellus scandens TaxID=2682957 RepID=A0ABR1JQE8_9AGAR
MAPGRKTLNSVITISYAEIFEQCLTLIHQSVGTDLGWEYPNYHLWSSVSSWACLVFTRRYDTTMTFAPQYSFFKVERSDTEGPPPRDSPYHTRALGSDNLEPGLVGWPDGEGLDQALLTAEELPSQSSDESWEEPEAQDADTSFASSNAEKLQWRTPDGTIFEHLPIPRGSNGPRPMLPIILHEGKPIKDQADVKIFLDNLEDKSSFASRSARADDLILPHLPQLQQQAQFLFAEYDDVDIVHGMVTYGWWWRGWILKRGEANELPEAEEWNEEAVPIFNDRVDRFHIELGNFWRAASSVRKPRNPVKQPRNFTVKDLEGLVEGGI